MLRGELAFVYRSTGKLDKALPLYEEALASYTAKLGRTHPETLNCINNLADAYHAAGQRARALPFFEEAARGMERLHYRHQFAPSIVRNTITVYEAGKHFDKAESWRRKWLTVVQERSGADSLAYAAELGNLSQNLRAQKKWLAVETTLPACLAILEKKRPDAWITFNTQSSIGAALLRRAESASDGKEKAKWCAEAEPLLLAGYDGMKQRQKSVPPQARGVMPEAIERLVQLHEATGKNTEAATWRKELEEIQTTQEKLEKQP